MKYPSLLKQYAEAEIITAYQARFIYYFLLASLVVLLVSIGYGSVIQLKDPFSPGLNLVVLGTEAGAFVLFLAVLVILIRGHFHLAAHLLLLVGLAAVWMVIFSDHSSPLARLDSVVFVFAVLSMTPLLIQKRVFLIFVYTLANVPVLWYFMFSQRSRLGLPDLAFFDYLADVTLAILFVSVTHFTLFSINSEAMRNLKADIERRVMAEASLRESQDRLAALLRFQNEMLETAAVWINTLDAQGRVTFWNKAAERISGYPKEEVLGHGQIWTWLYPDETYRQEVFAKAADIIQNGARVENFETIIQCKGGEKRVVSWFSNNLSDETEQGIGSIALGVDLTLQRQEQKEREQLETQMRQVQKMESIGRLAGGVAHDFNNLLTAIIGSADLALMKISHDSPFLPRFETIKQAAESAAGLTRRLLAFSRKQVIEPRSLDLNELVTRMQGMFTRIIGENVTRTFQLQPGLPLIKADPGQIEQVIMNLVVNACDAMPRGGVLIIETSSHFFDADYCRYHPQFLPGGHVMLSVSDTGTGMSPEVLEHLYEPFFTTKSHGRGTGLGLATVYGVVKQSGGVIECYSEADHGTSFKVYFPVSVEERSDLPVPEAFAEEPSGDETILVVEDNQPVRDFIRDSLRRLGYQVLCAESAEEAMSLVSSVEEKIDLMMTDVILPGINGRELAHVIMKQRPEIRVLFSSGYAGDVLSRSGVIEAGLNFISKPFGVSALARKIRLVLEMGHEPAGQSVPPAATR